MKYSPEFYIIRHADFFLTRRVKGIIKVRVGNMGIRGEVFSSKTSVGKRTYFFNVKENRHGDLFLNIVESKKHEGTGFERHSVIVFNEDLESFVEELHKAVGFMQSHGGEKAES